MENEKIAKRLIILNKDPTNNISERNQIKVSGIKAIDSENTNQEITPALQAPSQLTTSAQLRQTLWAALGTAIGV